MNEIIELLEELCDNFRFNQSQIPTDGDYTELIDIEHIQAIEDLIKRNKELESELQYKNDQLFLGDTQWEKYIDKNFIPKSKLREIVNSNLKNTKLNSNGYCFSFEGCQKVVKEIFKLIQEGE